MDKNKRCFSVSLESEQVEQLQRVKENTEKSQSMVLEESVGHGLKNASFFLKGKMLYLVKVRIDTGRLPEFGQKLQNGELQTDMYLFTWCEKDDPEVGTSLWIADNRDHLDQLIAPHGKYYREVIDIKEVITPQESMRMLMNSV
jgi:predicted DNA-binding protein